jgi:D-threonate/D-erythronate kinase
MSADWLILADDLTGAADAAVAFARRGCATEVTWGATAIAGDTTVHARDLGSRASSAADAAERHREACDRWYVPGQRLFKKIDSTLRGQPAAEMAALAAGLRARGQPSWGLLAPANPAMRRTVLEGRVLVDGAPLEDTVTWKREHTYPSARLADVVRSAGLRAVPLSLAELRGDGDAVKAAVEEAAAAPTGADTILICDAETDDDLARIVEAARPVAPGFFIGTAGLAQALAHTVPATERRRAVAAPRRGTLVAVGTLAAVSRRAVRRLAARDGLEIMTMTQDDSHRVVARDGAAARLARGETVVALLDAGADAAAPDPQHVIAFAEALSGALAQMGALIVTGGETAAALLARCGVHGIGLVDEVEPGIALGVTRGATQVPVVTKPGAFGDDGSLCRCLDAVAALERTA